MSLVVQYFFREMHASILRSKLAYSKHQLKNNLRAKLTVELTYETGDQKLGNFTNFSRRLAVRENMTI